MLGAPVCRDLPYLGGIFSSLNSPSESLRGRALCKIRDDMTRQPWKKCLGLALSLTLDDKSGLEARHPAGQAGLLRGLDHDVDVLVGVRHLFSDCPLR
jgi:hypothetical protein